MRALAHIEKIEWVKEITGADNIELIGVLGWCCIAKKGEFKENDIAVYIEIDSKCPSEDERFAFLEKKNYKVKTMKLGKFKVISQGLALPINSFPELKDCNVGDDVTGVLKIGYASPDDVKRKTKQKIDKNAKYNSMAARCTRIRKYKLFRMLMKNEVGRRLLFLLFGKDEDIKKTFPDWIIKTDETRCENIPYVLKDNDTPYIVTEKMDGSSATFAVERNKRDYEFIVCSRNVRLYREEQNNYWKMADQYNIENVLMSYAKENRYNRVVLQGEIIGEGIQKNPYKINGHKFFVFNLIVDGNRVSSFKSKDFAEKNGIPHVPILNKEWYTPTTMQELKEQAEGYSVVNPKVKREGLVYRTLDGKSGFKNVSNSYLLKHNG